MGKTDFLDPIHHKAATGRNSYNLDGWMLSRYTCTKNCYSLSVFRVVQMDGVEYCHNQDIWPLHYAAAIARLQG